SPSSPLSSPSLSLIAGSRATQVPSTAPNATKATATAMCAFRSSFAPMTGEPREPAFQTRPGPGPITKVSRLRYESVTAGTRTPRRTHPARHSAHIRDEVVTLSYPGLAPVVAPREV